MLDARTLGKAVLEPEFTVGGALALATPQTVAEAVAAYEGIQSLDRDEPDLKGPLSDDVRKWLKPIGMKAWPDLPHAAKSEWLNAMLLALSDLPGRVAVSATRQAVHRPFRFPNEVEPVIREIAAGILHKHTVALARLKLMQAEIHRAANPPPQIEERPMEWTEESVAEANAIFRRVSAKTRFRLSCDGVENYTPNEAEKEQERLAEGG